MPNPRRDAEIANALHNFEAPASPDTFFSDLRSRLESTPQVDAKAARRRPTFRSVSFRVLAVAAAITVVASLPVLLRDDDTRFVAPASAADVINRSFDALGSFKTLSGRMELSSSYYGYEGCSADSPDAHTNDDGSMSCGDGLPHENNASLTVQLLLSDDGSYRYESSGNQAGTATKAYDAKTGIATGFGTSVVQGLMADGTLPDADPPAEDVNGYRITGVIPAGPDAKIALEQFGIPQTGNALQALKQQNQLSLKDATFDGKPAYEIGDASTGAVFGSEGQLRLLVDRDTFFPVFWELTGNSEIPGTLTYSFHDLKINDDHPRSSFTAKIPESVDVTTYDEGGRATKAESAAPTWTPTGYRLASTTHVEKAEPRRQGVTVFQYRKGFQSITVTTRNAGPPETLWNENFLYDTRDKPDPQLRTLRAGAFASTTVNVYASEPSLPAHIWGKNDKQVVTVDGDASVDELVRIAESMR